MRAELETLLYGKDPTPGLVAVEPAGSRQVRLYRRQEGKIFTELDTFTPWLLLARPEDRAALGEGGRTTPLEGPGYNLMATFPDWPSCLAARQRLREAGADSFSYSSVVEQYLTLSGKALFRGMPYGDLHRLQLDIETLGLDPGPAENRVILIAITDSRDYERVLSGREMTEREMLEELERVIAARDPDVVEGHNLFDFDLPYLGARAARHELPLRWGRDGSALWLGRREDRFKVGPRLIAYSGAHIYGRHIVDTYQQIQRYDRAGELGSYGLKAVVEALGLRRPDRTFVDRKEIPVLWEKDPGRLARYALDDARDVRDLSAIIVPTEFYQAQMVPRSFQDAATGGTGEKINALLVRAYLGAGSAIPLPAEPQPYPGGYTEVRLVGIYRRVVKSDVESLYPAIMLGFGIAPSSDRRGLFLRLLEELTERRLQAKARTRESQGPERAYWDALQGSLKLLINSFYGYLGYAGGSFSDYQAAAQVTATGQEIIKKVVALLESRGCQVIEVDTDGVYFVPPAGVESEAAELSLIEQVSRQLPAGIRLAHDGRYYGMISLKAKNYVLLDYDRALIMKGSSLRNRRDERFLREFARQAARGLLEGSWAQASALYQATAAKIMRGELTVGDFARWESITPKTFANPKLRRLAAAAKGTAVGQRVAVYRRADGALAPAAEYAGDEDRDYLLSRLHDMAGRFRPLCATEEEFLRYFPKLTARPSAGQPAQAPPQQLALFPPDESS